MKVLAVVPARCGSKGFPHKNIAKLQGKTLLELAIRVGMDCDIIDEVYVSTDCEVYEKLAVKSGAKSLGLRSEALSSDTAKSVDVVIDLIESLEEKYDYVVLLQPTSPVRTPKDIENMFSLILQKQSSAIVSVVKHEEPHPYKLKVIDSSGQIQPFLEGSSSEVARQSLPDIYALNGAIYIVNIKSMLKEKTFFPRKTIPYIMSKSTNINIDSEEDFIFLQAMIKHKKIKLWINDA